MRYVDDVLIVAGGAAVTFGVWLVHIPAAWIVGGVLTVAFGVLVGRGLAARERAAPVEEGD